LSNHIFESGGAFVDYDGRLKLLTGGRMIALRRCENRNQLIVDLSNQADKTGKLKERIYLVNAPRSRDKKERRSVYICSYISRPKRLTLS
jgi:hypothetical protein